MTILDRLISDYAKLDGCHITEKNLRALPYETLIPVINIDGIEEYLFVCNKPGCGAVSENIIALYYINKSNHNGGHIGELSKMYPRICEPLNSDGYVAYHLVHFDEGNRVGGSYSALIKLIKPVSKILSRGVLIKSNKFIKVDCNN